MSGAIGQQENEMEMTRRGFLKGILAAAAAPAIITTPGLLMPVRKLWTPQIWTAVDPAVAHAIDQYGAWITVEYNSETGTFRTIDYGPKDKMKFSGAVWTYDPQPFV